ncbi:hypothetical protein CEXT_681051 [Caerostris extrusa]|uniref:Uncharacterized protein n=1 Tax=Caerostris extrusa TaxID=172846 RepID=A0AAV4WQX6_CAEEX|nr:hypothetical protein CEXT_681051 [Caerostris extrusa]
MSGCENRVLLQQEMGKQPKNLQLLTLDLAVYMIGQTSKASIQRDQYRTSYTRSTIGYIGRSENIVGHWTPTSPPADWSVLNWTNVDE